VSVQTLAGFGYRELFQRADQSALDAVWNTSDAGRELRRVVRDSTAQPVLRFLAAEVLFARDPGFPSGESAEALADLYAAALRLDATGMANPWGLPGEAGAPVAGHVVALGEAALDAFAGLLGDDTPVLYGGSREATFGNSHHFRVKDIAASVVAQILGVPLPRQLEPSDRDAEIEALRTRLRNGRGDPA
jgi:hypothetical protein